MLQSILFVSFCLLFFAGCSRDPKGKIADRKVFIKLEGKRYLLYRNGEPFVVKGGAGFTNLKELKEAGGNTIRVWDTTRLQSILDSAQSYSFGVVVGLPMPLNDDMDQFYNRKDLVDKHHAKMMALVNKFKDHPALLCWCLGNELAFPFKPNFNKFYQAFNNLVDAIHNDDPDHPVTTTVMTFQKKNIVNIKLRTNIDLISFNIFGSINTLKADLKEFSWYWDGPFLITEWGIEGPWVSGSQNAWGAYVENTSTKKAEQLLDTYQRYMPYNDPRYLGSMIFYWGQKQELTPTWFSLFDIHGRKTEAVDVLRYIWTGKRSAIEAPSVKYMLLDDKGGNDNILLKPGDITNAVVLMNSDTSQFRYHWELMREDWYKPNAIFSEKRPRPLPNLLLSDSTTKIRFKTPLKEGPYRLFVYVYNKAGYVATANTPFYIISDP